MPRGGHNRKTATQAKQDGTYRSDRHTDPVSIAPGKVEPPDGCSDAVLEVWNQYIEPRLESGLYEPADAASLHLWCIFYLRAKQANDLIPLGGVYESEDDEGRVTFLKHPAVGIMKDMAAEFRALSARLGLDTLGRLALGDAGERPGAQFGPQLPKGAPAAWSPKVVTGGKRRT